MARSTDFLTAALKRDLAPTLVEAGFRALGSRHFVRVRSELVDSIAVQVSRYGDQGFYVHAYVGLLCDPNFNLDGYHVGARHDAHPADGSAFYASDAELAAHSMAGVRALAEGSLLPWFARIDGPGAYLIEHIANPNTALDDLAVAAALVRLGHTNRAWWICENLAQNQDADHTEQRALAQRLQAAILESSAHTLLDAISAEHLRRDKLSPLAA